jgi:SAM-dependent methyltransferase
MQSRKEYKPSFEKQAAYYDAIYEAQGKDYQKEASQINQVIEKYQESPGKNLLDVCCGTGGHFPYLNRWYFVEGLDLDEHMLGVARKRFPEGIFHQGDMLDFHLNRKFDAITCLFSAIGYVKTPQNLRAAVKNMSDHLTEGGVLIIEPWLPPDKFKVGIPFATYVDKPDLKIARININEREGDVSIINFHFLVATEGKIEYFTELHGLGLFDGVEYLGAFNAAGLATSYDQQGITGRGLYIGVKPLSV